MSRIYTVTSTNSPSVRLVRASSQAQAINHCVKNDYKATVASQDDLISNRDKDVEVAGNTA